MAHPRQIIVFRSQNKTKQKKKDMELMAQSLQKFVLWRWSYGMDWCVSNASNKARSMSCTLQGNLRYYTCIFRCLYPLFFIFFITGGGVILEKEKNKMSRLTKCVELDAFLSRVDTEKKKYQKNDSEHLLSKDKSLILANYLNHGTSQIFMYSIHT